MILLTCMLIICLLEDHGNLRPIQLTKGNAPFTLLFGRIRRLC